MNVHVQVFVCMYIFNLLVYVYSGVEFIDHVVSTCLNSEGLLRPFSKSVASILCFIILYCTSKCEDLRVLISSHFLPNPDIFHHFYCGHFILWWEQKHLLFTFMSLFMWNWIICIAWYKYDFFQYWDLIVLVVQLLSLIFKTPWTAAWQASLSFTISQRLTKLMSIGLVMPSKHLVLCHPPFLLPSIFPSIRVFSNESALCIR